MWSARTNQGELMVWLADYKGMAPITTPCRVDIVFCFKAKSVTSPQIGDLDNLTKAKVIADRNVDKVKIIWNDPSHREDKSRNLWSLYNAVTQFTSHQVEPTSYELAQRINRGTLVALNKASLVEADFKKLTTAVANN